MPQLPTDSELIFLSTIWALSLVLIGLAAIMLVWLILTRVVRRRADKGTALRRDQLSLVLHTVLNAPIEPDADGFAPLRRGDEPIICGIALDMLRLIRGKDVLRLMALLESWGIKTYLQGKLRGGGRGQRIRALALLARFGDEDSLKLLFSCIGDPDPYVQMAALRGIASRREPAHLPAIIECLISSPKQRNTLMLADVLKGFRETAVPYLLVLAKSEASVEVRLAAIRALSAIGSLDAVTGLSDLACHSERDIRAQALSALGRLGDKRGHAAVLDALGSTDYAVRAAAAQAAGALHAQEAIPALMDLLGDSVWWVRYRAAEALGQVGAAGLDVLGAIAGSQGPGGDIALEILAERESSRP